MGAAAGGATHGSRGSADAATDGAVSRRNNGTGTVADGAAPSPTTKFARTTPTCNMGRPAGDGGATIGGTILLILHLDIIPRLQVLLLLPAVDDDGSEKSLAVTRFRYPFRRVSPYFYET